jgi:hypothetical protein
MWTRPGMGTPHGMNGQSDFTQSPRGRRHLLLPTRPPCIQGYPAHKKQPPPWDHHRTRGIVLL